ncbi:MULTISPECIES: oxygenase MpaB family protein [unclassified Rhodococcus (in: high G+C Gram-positive bacteria)]|uniref:oxygenase MpaB family protein n=1 Tax=Rhodococcus sp. SJ-3 TaxID=3454628 RepID=UPI003F79DA94
MSDIDRSGLLHRYLADKRFLLALPRAVGLQMLHPALAAGMEHSRTPRRLWLHKRHTVPIFIRMAYDDTDMSLIIKRGHERIKGVDGLGHRYHSLNPDLFQFQHATYVETLVTMIDTFVRPLTDEDRENVYRDCCGWFRRYGISDTGLPGTWAEFTGWFDDTCSAQLRRTDAGDFFHDQVVRPSDWVQRRVPTCVVRALMHPIAQEMWGVEVRASDRRALVRYVLRRKAIAMFSSPPDPLRV